MFTKEIYMIENIKEPGIYYHLGVVDYFQEYDYQKKGEKLWKELTHWDKNLDTSS